jgi:pyruvate dehydrogenase E1 component beta subunit
VTVAAISYMTLEAIRAASFLAEEGIDVEVLDVRTLRPLDDNRFLDSVRKTGRLLVADTSWTFSGYSAELLALASEKAFRDLRCAPRRLGTADCPIPSTPALANLGYPRAEQIVDAVRGMMGRQGAMRPWPQSNVPLDVPDPSFTGPF